MHNANVEDYPAGILRDLQPRHVLLTHWEDFFSSPESEARVLRYHDIADFVTRVEHAVPADADWTLLKPFDSVRFRVCD